MTRRAPLTKSLRAKTRSDDKSAGVAPRRRQEGAPPMNVSELSRVLYVPEHVIHMTWEALRQTALQGCEGTVRWAGPAYQWSARQQLVTTVLVPHQRVAAGAFEVPHHATRQMGKALADTELVNLAQLHTHPGSWVGHSAWDDAHAYSLRDGALSIVWPHYGATIAHRSRWGIHECQHRVWRHLKGAKAAARLRILPALIDLREQFERLDPFVDDVEGDAP